MKGKSFRKSNLKQDFKIKLKLIPGPRQGRIGFYHSMPLLMRETNVKS